MKLVKLKLGHALAEEVFYGLVGKLSLFALL